jgi:hypothetical protein
MLIRFRRIYPEIVVIVGILSPSPETTHVFTYLYFPAISRASKLFPYIFVRILARYVRNIFFLQKIR